MGISFFNRERYADPTAFFAVKALEKKDRLGRRRPKVPVITASEDKMGPNYPEESVAIAVVVRAAEDYREARRMLQWNPRNPKALQMREEAEEFFLGEEILRYTAFPGSRLLERLEREFESEGEVLRYA